MTQTLSKTLLEVREQLTERCVKTLLAYRKHCAASVAAGQLILPECYKLFPVYALALSKQKAIKGIHFLNRKGSMRFEYRSDCLWQAVRSCRMSERILCA